MMRPPGGGASGRSGGNRSYEALAVILIALLLIGLYATARHSAPFQIVEGHFLDWRFQARGPIAANEHIAIVAIDDKTLSQIGRWPFSRRWLAQTLEVLRGAGARAVAFDLLLTGASTQDGPASGPEPLFPAPDRNAGSAAAIDDRTLAKAIARMAPTIIPYGFTFAATAPDTAPALPGAINAAAFRIVQQGPDAGAAEPAIATGALLPQTAFLEAGAPAHVTVFYEADGKVRFAHPVIKYGREYYPSLPLEATRLYLGQSRSELAFNEGESVRIGGRSYRLEDRQRLAINFVGPAGSFPQYPLIDVAEGRTDPDAFRGRIVLIGATATGLGDRFATSFDTGLSGVELLATMTDNMLAMRPLRQDGLAAWLDLLAILSAAALALALGLIHRPAAILLSAAAVIVGLGILYAYAFAAFDLWLNATFPLLMLVTGTAAALIGRSRRERHLRALAERQTEALSPYVSPLTALGLRGAANETSVNQGHTATIMFVDLVGYTTASEQIPAEASAALLRHFHALVERNCAAFGGVVDKYIGDGALLVFGIPSAGPLDAANAIGCAQAVATALNAPDNPMAAGYERSPTASFGIHMGPVHLVELGGQAHRQITVTGDTVNVASRLEAMTREWQAEIIVSGAVFAAAQAAGSDDRTLGFERLPVTTVRGRTQPLELWAWKQAR